MCIASTPDMPKPPAMPKPPKMLGGGTEEEERRRRMAAASQNANVATSASGLTRPAVANKKMLFGS